MKYYDRNVSSINKIEYDKYNIGGEEVDVLKYEPKKLQKNFKTGTDAM